MHEVERYGMIPVALFLLSIGLQLAAAIYALLLTRITGRRLAWTLISIAMLLMASRRIVSFVSILSSGKKVTFDTPELIALLISILMLWGVLRIGDYFRSTRSLEEERKQADDQIRKISKEWSVTFDSMKDLISVHDKDFRIVRVNKAFAAAVGMQPEELIGKFCYEVIHKTGEPWPVCPHKMVFESAKPHTTEIFEPGWGAYLEVSASPVLDDEGEITATVHIIKDITERKKAEADLRNKVEELEKFYEMAVGRELKMKELKKEITKLREELARCDKTKS